MQYTIDGINWKYVDNDREFVGNTNRNTVVTNLFLEPVVARAVRICPTKWH